MWLLIVTMREEEEDEANRMEDEEVEEVSPHGNPSVFRCLPRQVECFLWLYGAISCFLMCWLGGGTTNFSPADQHGNKFEIMIRTINCDFLTSCNFLYPV